MDIRVIIEKIVSQTLAVFVQLVQIIIYSYLYKSILAIFSNWII